MGAEQRQPPFRSFNASFMPHVYMFWKLFSGVKKTNRKYLAIKIGIFPFEFFKRFPWIFRLRFSIIFFLLFLLLKFDSKRLYKKVHTEPFDVLILCRFFSSSSLDSLFLFWAMRIRKKDDKRFGVEPRKLCKYEIGSRYERATKK